MIFSLVSDKIKLIVCTCIWICIYCIQLQLPARPSVGVFAAPMGPMPTRIATTDLPNLAEARISPTNSLSLVGWTVIHRLAAPVDSGDAAEQVVVFGVDKSCVREHLA